MLTNYKTICTCLLMMTSCTQLFAQKQIIISPKINEVSVSQLKHVGEPNLETSENFSFNLTINDINTPLKEAFLNSTSNASYTIELPTPEGSIHQFNIERNTTMHPDLAAKYPEISTFNVFGVTNKAETGKLDITPYGLHLMIFSPNGTYFIDPYNISTNEYYQSFYKKNVTSTSEYECSVGEELYSDFEPSAAAFGSCELRTYRLALACTGEYANFHGSTTINNDKTNALAAQVTTMNRVNGVYERTFSITMEIVANNDQLIFLNPSTDPYSNNNGGVMLGQNQTQCDNIIGSSNYDIGHVFSTGGGGIASLGSVCSSTRKGQGVTGLNTPVGDNFDIDFVCHEMGHQFAANHTFNNSCSGNINPSTAFETGSGSTIMGYAGVCSPSVQSHSDDYFHGASLQEVGAFITSGGHTCPVKTPISNSAPVITSTTGSKSIPVGTPFALTAEATDANGDDIYFQWEQMDKESSTQPPVGTSTKGPLFRSYDPVMNDGTRYFPRLGTYRLAGTGSTWEAIPTVARSMKFRVVASDYNINGGCTTHKDITIDVVDGDPFIVLYPSEVGITWYRTTTETVLWDVAGTDASPINCTNVDIYLSTDGGKTFPEVLALNVPNDGEHDVTVPSLPTNTARVMVRCADQTFFNISSKDFKISQNTASLENKNSSFKVFPNPTKDLVSIYNSDVNFINTSVTVTDITGKIVLIDKIESSKSTFDFSKLNTGIYFIRLYNEKENTVVKLIKE